MDTSKLQKLQELEMVIDILIEDARSSLARERAAKRRQKAKLDAAMNADTNLFANAAFDISANDIEFETSFTPWAAAANVAPAKQMKIKDHLGNLIARFFDENGQHFCEISVARETPNSIARCANKKACLFFKNNANFMGEFNDKGIMRIALPALENGEVWHNISFIFKQLKNNAKK